MHVPGFQQDALFYATLIVTGYVQIVLFAATHPALTHFMWSTVCMCVCLLQLNIRMCLSLKCRSCISAGLPPTIPNLRCCDVSCYGG